MNEKKIIFCLTCSDSRINPSKLFPDCNVFASRNIGNIFSNSNDDKFLHVKSSADVAVNVFSVDRFVVLGHSDCRCVELMKNCSDCSENIKKFITERQDNLNNTMKNKETQKAFEFENIKISCNELDAYLKSINHSNYVIEGMYVDVTTEELTDVCKL